MKADKSYSNTLKSRLSLETREKKGSCQAIIKMVDYGTKGPKAIRTHRFAWLGSGVFLGGGTVFDRRSHHPSNRMEEEWKNVCKERNVSNTVVK